MEVNLSKAVRSNLLSLQSTAKSMAETQNRLATGLKVNSALDNPSNFFTAAALNSRAGDMANLMDSMSSGIKTIEAADNGLKSITKTVESMQSTLRQARQDKSFKTGSFSVDTDAVTAASIDTAAEGKQISISGGSVGDTGVNIDLTTAKGSVSTTGNLAATFQFDEAVDTIDFELSVDGGTTLKGVTIEAGATGLKVTVGSTVTDNIAVGDIDAVTTDELISAINTGLQADGYGVTASGESGGKLTFSNNTATNTTEAVAVQISGFALGTSTTGTAINAAALGGLTAGASGVTAGGTAGVTDVTAKTVDALVSEINGAASGLADKVRASNDNGKLRLENQSTKELEVVGVSGTSGKLDGTTGASNTAKIGGNDVRKNLEKQFNDLRDQLDKFADDASFNGINLLRGDKLKLTFNETGTSTIEIQAKDETGAATSINNTALKIDSVVAGEFDSDSTIDTKLDTLSNALNSLRSQSSTFGSNLSVVENRQDFTKNMINTLETGAANLTLADTNEEAANLLALQTRQQLSSTALSMASQADQAVLRLF